MTDSGFSLKRALNENGLDGVDSLPRQIYRLLRNLMMRLVLPPGHPLSEKEVAAALSISKTPVREAFIRLAADDIVRIVPRSGTYVPPIRLQRAMEGVFVWTTLESSAAEYAVDNCSFRDISRLRDIVDRQHLHLMRGHRDAFLREGARFHAALLELGGFLLVPALIETAKFEVERLKNLMADRVRRSDDQALAEHGAIVNAMARRDPEAVRLEALRHFSWVDELLANAALDAAGAGSGDGKRRRRRTADADLARRAELDVKSEDPYGIIRPPEILRETPVAEAVCAIGLRGDGTITERMYALLHKLIVNLHLMPNQAISENEIADCLRVSKTPVREAFIRLSDEGLLNILPKKGTFVAPIDVGRVLEGFFIRLSLEAACAEKIARDGTESDMDRLRRVLDVQERCLRVKDYGGFYVMDNKYHAATFAIAGLPNTKRLVDTAKSEVDRIKSLKSVYRVCRSEEELYAEHLELFDAMASRDPARARNAIRRHLTGMSEAVQALAKEESLWRFVNDVNRVSVNSRSPSPFAGIAHSGKGSIDNKAG